MRKWFIAVLLPLLLLVCGAQTPPTATEAFNLRIRCKQMADQKANDLREGAALAKWEVSFSSGSSRYDAINNRCYILIYHEIRKPGYEYLYRYLYDAQVDDLLANADIKNGKYSGSIWDENYKGQCVFKGGIDCYEEAIRYMNEMMADPRKQ
jgi:hypothetical protein